MQTSREHASSTPLREEIDDISRWFHFRVCVATGVGFFTDAYDIFAISIASVMLAYVYGCPQEERFFQSNLARVYFSD